MIFGARMKPPDVPSALPHVCSVMTLSRPSNGAARPPPLRPEHAGRVGFVDHDHCLVPVRDSQQFSEVRVVTVHAVEAFDRQPGPPLAAGPAPFHDRRIKRIGIVMLGADGFSAAKTNAVMDAGVDQFVMHDEITALRQRREDGEVGDVATTKIERRFSAEEGCRFAFQRFMFRMIATQQTRSTRPDRHSSRQRIRSSLSQFRGFSQTEIVVRCEIDARAPAQRPETTPVRERL